jgi:hypothetical protein
LRTRANFPIDVYSGSLTDRRHRPTRSERFALGDQQAMARIGIPIHLHGGGFGVLPSLAIELPQSSAR